MMNGLKTWADISRRVAPAFAVALIAIARLHAAGDKPSARLANDPRYIQALRALDEGIPQVSIENLNECLASKLPADDRVLVTFQLAKAFLAAGCGVMP